MLPTVVGVSDQLVVIRVVIVPAIAIEVVGTAAGFSSDWTVEESAARVAAAIVAAVVSVVSTARVRAVATIVVIVVVPGALLVIGRFVPAVLIAILVGLPRRASSLTRFLSVGALIIRAVIVAGALARFPPGFAVGGCVVAGCLSTTLRDGAQGAKRYCRAAYEVGDGVRDAPESSLALPINGRRV